MLLLMASGCGRLSYDPPPIDAGIDATFDAATARDGNVLDAPSVDAPSIDAPSVDAPSVDAPSFDAPSVDAAVPTDAPSLRALLCRDAIACLDFEAPFAPPLTAVAEAGSATPTRDTLRPFRGSALHLSASSAASTTSRVAHPVPSTVFSAGLVYVSAWVRVEREDVPAYLALIELNNAVPPPSFVKISLDHNTPDALSLYTSADYQLQPGGFPTARWVCVELWVRPEAGMTRATVRAEGFTLTALDPIDPGLLEYVDLSLASEFGTHDVWYDDVYVGTSEVGCLPE